LAFWGPHGGVSDMSTHGPRWCPRVDVGDMSTHGRRQGPCAWTSKICFTNVHFWWCPRVDIFEVHAWTSFSSTGRRPRRRTAPVGSKIGRVLRGLRAGKIADLAWSALSNMVQWATNIIFNILQNKPPSSSSGRFSTTTATKRDLLTSRIPFSRHRWAGWTNLVCPHTGHQTW
jgi:hypothetical protein